MLLNHCVVPFSRIRVLPLILCLLAGFALAAEARAAGLDDRDSEPVVITGAETPLLTGSAPTGVVAFSWFSGTWQQVPVQVDERKMIDYRPIRQAGFNPGNEFRELAYADPDTWAEADGVPQTVTTPANPGSGAPVPGTTGDPTLDQDDEIAMMAADAGESAAGRAAPAGVDPATRTPVRVSDPLDPGNSRFIYLFLSEGDLDPDADSDYVSYEQAYSPPLTEGYRHGYNFGSIGDDVAGPPVNPEASVISTPRYEIGIPGRWMVDRIVISAGDDEVDILDGDKSTVSPSGCGRNELTFSRGGGGFIANVDGPVRAIRSFIGANSGTFTQREYVFYEGMWESRTFLRVHPGINSFVSAMDLSPAASGMTYRNSNNPGGVTIDGVQDSPAAGSFTWEQFSGQYGSVTNVSRLTTDIGGVTQSSYYQDMATPAPSSSMLCSGDDHSYGAAGPTVTTPRNNTDPVLVDQYPELPLSSFSVKRQTWFDGPEANVALGAERASQVDNPLLVETGSATDPVPEPEPKAKLSLRVKPARIAVRSGGKRRVRVTVHNPGDGPARKVRICLGRHRAIRSVPCQKIALLAAGGSVTRRFGIKPRRKARPGKRSLRFKASAPGVTNAKATLKVRVRRR